MVINNTFSLLINAGLKVSKGLEEKGHTKLTFPSTLLKIDETFYYVSTPDTLLLVAEEVCAQRSLQEALNPLYRSSTYSTCQDLGRAQDLTTVNLPHGTVQIRHVHSAPLL